MIWLVLGVALAALMALRVPVAFAFGIVAVMGFLLQGVGSAAVAAQRFVAGINSYPLLALPLFILAGNLLVAGGVIHRLVAFADVVVGGIRGGLAQVNVIANFLMAGVSGSATADTAALGSVMLPMMEARGYERAFIAALTVSGAIIAPIVPPSLVMVIYAIPTKLSIGAMFLAGVVPGMVIAGLLMVYVRWACRAHPLAERRADAPSRRRAVLEAIPVLGAPLIVVGGVRGGVFTATEAAAVLVAYVFLVTLLLYRSLDLRGLAGVLRESAVTTATVMLVVATSSMFAWFLAVQGVPNAMRAVFLAMTDEPVVFLLLTNFFLLVVGCFVDTVPAILIFVPILQPTAVSFGIDPIHFAIVVIVNLMIGLNTPPLGTNLFVISSIAERGVGEVTRALLPFYAVKLVALGLITYVPALSLWLPRVMGLIP